jgi:hypothetical protein
MSADDEARGPNHPSRTTDSTALVGWRGDDHKLQLESAVEAGLPVDDAAVDLYTKGFSAGITIDDPADRAIVARGRTVLGADELRRSLRPALRFLGIAPELVEVAVLDGRFVMRIHQKAAEATKPLHEAGKLTLQLWIGFGMLGLAALRFMPEFVTAILWGVGLMLGGWQLRRGLASGRAMLAARMAIALALMAQQEQLVLPPEGGTT